MHKLLCGHADEIKNDDADDRSDGVHGIDAAEIAGLGDPFIINFSSRLIKWADVPLHNAAGRGRKRAPGAAHELALHQPGIDRRAGDVVKMRLRVQQQPFARRQIRTLQHCANSLMQSGKNLLQRRGV